MKILFFLRKVPSPNSRFIWDEAVHLSRQHELVILATEPRIGELPAGVATRIIPFVQTLIQRKWHWWLWKTDVLCTFKNRRFSRQLDAYIRDFNPDVIHCHFGYEALLLTDNYRGTKPIAIHFHGYDASEMLRKKSYVLALKRLSHRNNVFWIGVSANIFSKLRKAGVSPPPSRHTIIHCGVNTDSFEFAPEAKGIIRFIQVSNLHEKKGVAFTLRAFQIFLKISNHPASLVICGEGPLKEELQKEVVQLNISNNVIFLGQVSANRVKAELEASHCFVHHSVTAKNGDQEGIPTAMMEAMAAGIPVISTWHSGIPELVEDGVNGYLVPEKDVKAYAQRMLDLCKWERFRLPENTDKVHREFSLKVHLERLQYFYNHMTITSQ